MRCEPRTLTTRAIVIATGARPFVPPIPGLQQVGYLTSETLWQLRELPPRLLVLGGGPVGSELAQAFARLGSQVTQVEMLSRILAREDPDVSQAVTERFGREGIRVLTSHTARECVIEGGRKILVAEHQGAEVRVEFDQLLVRSGALRASTGWGWRRSGSTPPAAARSRRTSSFERGSRTSRVRRRRRSYQFTHTASHQAWYAAVNALFGRFWTFRADYRVIPWTTFVDPEVGRVGSTSRKRAERKLAFEATVYPMAQLDRAIADGDLLVL